MRGASAEASAALREELAAAIDRGADGERIAEDLFGVATLLDSEPSLRRVLTDVSLDPEAKAALIRQVLGRRLDSISLQLVADAAGRRWAATRDLGATLEHLGVVAVVRAADRAGEADALENQLFAFERTVSGNPQLRDALSDPARSTYDKQRLVRGLLSGRATAGTMRLVEQSLSGAHRTVAVALEEYQRVAAAERNRMTAVVRVARPLGAGAAERLTGALSRHYGRPVHLNEVVDPDVLGGIRVEIGDDVIDGTVVTRLDAARRQVAG